MKIEMNSLGMLIVTPESGVEKYALDKWLDENLEGKTNINIGVKQLE